MAHLLFFLKLYRNIHRFFQRNPLHFCQTFRLTLYNVKGITFKLFDYSCRQCRTHSLNSTRCKIPFHCRFIFRLLYSIRCHPILRTMGRMIYIFAFRTNILALVDIMKISHEDFVPVGRFNFHYGISIFLIMKANMTNISFQMSHLKSPTLYQDTQCTGLYQSQLLSLGHRLSLL